MEQAGDLPDEVLAAMHGGRWAEAVDRLERHLDESAEGALDRASTFDILADARWWLGDAQGAADAREQVYILRARAGDAVGAARAAAWLAREYAAGVGNLPAARGWLARAERLTNEQPDAAIAGWIALAQATLATDAATQIDRAEDALGQARASGDADLEVLALARSGLGMVIAGQLDAGLARLDEAMVTASTSDTQFSTTSAQLCCDFVLASELSGDPNRFGRWSDAVERVAAARGGPSPVSFCTTCCAEQSAAHGDYAGAEKQLHVAVVELEQSGRKSRCIPPGTKLAELYLMQGRTEEAERAVGDADDEASLVVRGRIAVARAEPALAITLLQRAVRRVEATPGLAATALAALVDAHLLAADLANADQALTQLEDGARRSGDARATALAKLARGHIALASQDAEGAETAFETVFDRPRSTTIEVGIAHLELARLRASDRAQAARVDAKTALRTFEELGATQLADAAAALLRSLGDNSRVGPKDVGVLSKREQEVLRLVAQGLTNAEIAARLYISTKTAGNHVSAILTKLGVRSRTEAAAYAALHTDQ